MNTQCKQLHVNQKSDDDDDDETTMSYTNTYKILETKNMNV